MQEEQRLPLTWYDILVHLSHAPAGRLRMQVLAESIVLSRSGLTRLLDRMTEAGLVRREMCREDRRGAFALITPKGRAALERAMPGHLHGIQEHFLNHLDDEDVRVLHGALSKILESEKDEGRGDCSA
jgi:DNA-binding MarR family transcriptional regulator